ncbi:SDR family NAD(P)-dependent oxidoreductase, partial [Streptomyces spongiae]
AELPTYPFQRRRYWPTPGTAPSPADAGEDSAFWSLVDDADTARIAAETGAGEPELAAVLPALADWRQRSRRRAIAASWSYREVWHPLPATATAPPADRLVVVPATHADDPWVAAVVAALGPGTARVDIDPATADRTTCAAVLTGQPAVVVSLLGIAEEPADARHPAVPAGLAATVALLQALADRPTGARLWCLTRETVSAVPGDTVRHPVQGTLWGLGRVAALEQPALWGGLADLPGTVDARTGGLLAALLTADATEDQLAVRPSGIYARRLLPAGEPTATQPWHTGGTALVTGGTGALGSRLAHWAVSRGATHVLLLSRRGSDAPGAATLTEQLIERGARVTVAACDTADRDALAAHLDALPADQPLSTVIHAAGVSDGDRETTALTPDTLEALLRAKLLGARHLHELTADRDLDAFVLFSSGAASWGSGGQGAYAAANAYLDALAQHRHAAGLTATSVAWGAWGETGMATEPALAAELARRGVHPMDPDTALAALQRALDEDATAMTVTATDWAAFLPAFTAARPSPLLSELDRAAAPRPTEHPEPEGGPSLRERLADLPDVERTRLLLDLVRTEAAATLGHSGADAVPAERALRDLGFDSVSAVDLRNRLKAATGLALPASLVFDHPNAAAVVAHLRTALFP